MPEETSEIDDAAFFLSPEGKTDAQGELEATIGALINEERLTEETSASQTATASFDDNATACRFPARKAWLVQELGMEGLSEVECRLYDTLMKRVDPQSVSLIFPSAYINSPASMFGHTFLRIDSSYKSKMLSHAINYAAAANPDTENGMVFAVKGLFGGYYGQYSLLPYYEKIKEYRDSEERDIWEYDFDLKPEEIEQMMRHIWELQNTYSYYYFFTENCSYNMLWLIEAARPSVHIREYFNYQVIPPETIHAAIDENIVTKRHFRPARRSKLLAYEAYFDDEDIKSVFQLSKAEITPQEFLKTEHYGAQKKRYILEASSEFVEYDFLAGDINQSTYKERLYSVLSARSILGKGEQMNIPEPTDPMKGHRSLRVSAQTGWRNGDNIQFLGIRPANHDIKDSDVGFLRGTQIEFFDLLFSHAWGDIDLEKATLLSIVSLSPRGKFFQPFSWRLGAGWNREYLSEKAVFATHGSGGFTWANELGYTYLLADVLANTDEEMTAGVGAIAGLVLYQGKAFKTNIETAQHLYDTGESQWIFNASQHYRSSQNTAISLSYDYVQKHAEDWKTVKFSLDYFF